MTELRATQFQPWHLAALNKLEDEKALIEAHADFFEFLAGEDGDVQLCATMFDDHWVIGQPLLIGGYYSPAPGVVQVFMLPSQDVIKRPKLLVKIARMWLAQIESHYPAWHRIQTFSLPLVKINRWMQFIGFGYEGRLRRYTESGQDYNVWSRVKIDGVWRGITS